MKKSQVTGDSIQGITVNEISEIAWNICEEKGFHEKKNEVGTDLMMIVSEASEALEADRKEKYAVWKPTKGEIEDILDDEEFKAVFEKLISGTFEDELSDIIIRTCHLSKLKNIDLERFIALKLRYNALRPKKFGGKKY